MLYIDMNAGYAAIEYLYDSKSSEQNRADAMLALTLYETRKTNSTISAETASQTRVGSAKPKQIGKNNGNPECNRMADASLYFLRLTSNELRRRYAPISAYMHVKKTATT